jgi:hypothetical protein
MIAQQGRKAGFPLVEQTMCSSSEEFEPARALRLVLCHPLSGDAAMLQVSPQRVRSSRGRLARVQSLPSEAVQR